MLLTIEEDVTLDHDIISNTKLSKINILKKGIKNTYARAKY